MPGETVSISPIPDPLAPIPPDVDCRIFADDPDVPSHISMVVPYPDNNEKVYAINWMGYGAKDIDIDVDFNQFRKDRCGDEYAFDIRGLDRVGMSNFIEAFHFYRTFRKGLYKLMKEHGIETFNNKNDFIKKFDHEIDEFVNRFTQQTAGRHVFAPEGLKKTVLTVIQGGDPHFPIKDFLYRERLTCSHAVALVLSAGGIQAYKKKPEIFLRGENWKAVRVLAYIKEVQKILALHGSRKASIIQARERYHDEHKDRIQNPIRETLKTKEELRSGFLASRDLQDLERALDILSGKVSLNALAPGQKENVVDILRKFANAEGVQIKPAIEEIKKIHDLRTAAIRNHFKAMKFGNSMNLLMLYPELVRQVSQATNQDWIYETACPEPLMKVVSNEGTQHALGAVAEYLHSYVREGGRLKEAFTTPGQWVKVYAQNIAYSARSLMTQIVENGRAFLSALGVSLAMVYQTIKTLGWNALRQGGALIVQYGSAAKGYFFVALEKTAAGLSVAASTLGSGVGAVSAGVIAAAVLVAGVIGGFIGYAVDQLAESGNQAAQAVRKPIVGGAIDLATWLGVLEIPKDQEWRYNEKTGHWDVNFINNSQGIDERLLTKDELKLLRSWEAEKKENKETSRYSLEINMLELAERQTKSGPLNPDDTGFPFFLWRWCGANEGIMWPTLMNATQELKKPPFHGRYVPAYFIRELASIIDPHDPLQRYLCLMPPENQYFARLSRDLSMPCVGLFVDQPAFDQIYQEKDKLRPRDYHKRITQTIFYELVDKNGTLHMKHLLMPKTENQWQQRVDPMRGLPATSPFVRDY